MAKYTEFYQVCIHCGHTLEVIKTFLRVKDKKFFCDDMIKGECRFCQANDVKTLVSK